MKRTILALLACLCLPLLPAKANAAIVSVNLSCLNDKNVSQTGAILFVDDKLAGIRLDSVTGFVVYGEDEQGMELVDPMEFNMEMHDIGDYSIVMKLTAGEVAQARAKTAFSLLLVGKGNAMNLNCSIQP